MGTWGVVLVLICVFAGMFVIRHYRYQAAPKNKARIDPKDTWVDAEAAARGPYVHGGSGIAPQYMQQQLPARNLPYLGTGQQNLRQRASYETPAKHFEHMSPPPAPLGHQPPQQHMHHQNFQQTVQLVPAAAWQQFRPPSAARADQPSSSAALPRPGRGRRAPIQRAQNIQYNTPNAHENSTPAFNPPPGQYAAPPSPTKPPAAVHLTPGGSAAQQGGNAYYAAQNAAMPLHVAAAQAAAASSLAASASEARLPQGDTEIKFASLQLGQLVGQGAFGRVYSGKWRGSPVAVKVLAVPSLTPELVDEFRGEAQLMAALRHPNVVLFMGVCSVAPDYAIVTEYMPRGSLWGVLHANEGAATPQASPQAAASLESWKPEAPGKLPWALVLQMAVQAARGLAFLHSASPPILHRDLKSGNLLVGDAWCIKLTDFGLSRVRGYAATMTGQVGTCQWMANEVLAQARYTEAADVFSFGVVLWELVTRECPYAHLPSSVQVAVAVLKDGLRPAVPPGVPSALGSLMQSCWHADATRRPNMDTVLRTLEAMR